jgi:hypothetical protein
MAFYFIFGCFFALIAGIMYLVKTDEDTPTKALTLFIMFLCLPFAWPIVSLILILIRVVDYFKNR